jgi:glutathione S-transferase
MTTGLAAFIPVGRRAAALDAIKALHTIIFASVGGAIGLFVWDGVRQRRGRRAAVALGIVLTESALYVSNNQVCPLTPLAEELGAERGSVADIFLPDWFSRRIPVVGGSMLVLGLVLNLWAWRGRWPARDSRL